ncbi:MAG: type II toxin-antitoxin system prevent-host-death family antitoxin [Okeania sp. SIO2H7]|nr:type II toxin-antitoxin system prevent-host-death family antitoxin [Okeania sp. SIO2H7]
MHKIDLADTNINLSDLVEKAMSGQEIVITKDNQPVVKLVSISPPPPPEKHSSHQAGSAEEHKNPRYSLFGSAKNQITTSDDSVWESEELVVSSKLDKLEGKAEELDTVFDDFKKLLQNLRD